MNNLQQRAEVRALDNGIIVTIEPLYVNLSKLTLSGPWYKFLYIGPLMRSVDDVQVHGWRGRFGFNHEGQLNQQEKTFTCTVFVSEIEGDIESLSTL